MILQVDSEALGAGGGFIEGGVNLSQLRSGTPHTVQICYCGGLGWVYEEDQ